MQDATIHCWPAVVFHRIPPQIFGVSIEPVGRSIYEGIWAGGHRNIPSCQGMRLDVQAALAHLRLPVLRWPGGAYANEYHWRDGIGNPKERPHTVNLHSHQIEPNTFGTHEYMHCCTAIGAAPYITLNTGSATIQEGRDWIEYCCFPGDSHLTKWRVANGQAQPFTIPLWNLGYEPWARGGWCSPNDYAKLCLACASYQKAFNPEGKCVACAMPFDAVGPYKPQEWNHELCRTLSQAALIDGLSIQRNFYCKAGLQFLEAEYYGLLAGIGYLTRDLELADALVRYYFPDQPIGLVINDWGVLYSEAHVDNGLEQPRPLRDGLVAAVVLHRFAQWASRVIAATLAQAVNGRHCLAVTDGDALFLSPTYHVFDMARGHSNAMLLHTEVDCPSIELKNTEIPQYKSLPLLDACASRSGEKVTVTLANLSLDTPLQATLCLHEANISSVSGRVLWASSPAAENSVDMPNRVTAKRFRCECEDSKITHILPPHSYTMFSLTLAE